MISGARKWQVNLDFDKSDFQNAIYKIYPRLNSVSGYTLLNIKRDKTFEELPAKVWRFDIFFKLKHILILYNDSSNIF